MKTYLLIIVIALIFPAFNYTCRATKFTINWNTNDSRVEFISINNTNYIELSSLALLFNNSSKIEDNSFICDVEVFKFASESFYAVYENGIKMRVIQLNIPVISVNGALAIPILSFLNALTRLELIDFKIITGKYIVKTNIMNHKVEIVRSKTETHSDSNSLDSVLLEVVSKSKKVEVKPMDIPNINSNSITPKVELSKSKNTLKIKNNTLNENPTPQSIIHLPEKPDSNLNRNKYIIPKNIIK